MTATLDVYIHRSGVVEMRQPVAVKGDSYKEAVPPHNVSVMADEAGSGLVPRWREVTWRRMWSPVNGVTVWAEM